MNRHEKLHETNGAKRLRCEFCKKAFYRPDNFNEHVKRCKQQQIPTHPKCNLSNYSENNSIEQQQQQIIRTLFEEKSQLNNAVRELQQLKEKIEQEKSELAEYIRQLEQNNEKLSNEKYDFEEKTKELNRLIETIEDDKRKLNEELESVKRTNEVKISAEMEKSKHLIETVDGLTREKEMVLKQKHELHGKVEELRRINNTLLRKSTIRPENQYQKKNNVTNFRASTIKSESEYISLLSSDDDDCISDDGTNSTVSFKLEIPPNSPGPSVDFQSITPPRYSEYIRDWAKKDAQSVTMIHDKITETVNSVKNGGNGVMQSYRFESYDTEKRQVSSRFVLSFEWYELISGNDIYSWCMRCVECSASMLRMKVPVKIVMLL